MSYDEKQGKYQKEFDILIKKIPETGESYDTRIEILRVALNLNYDMGNNGMQNCTNQGSRQEEYQFLESKIDMGYVGEFMTQLQSDEDDDIDFEDRKSEEMYDKAVKEFASTIIDRVIEKIKSMNYDFGGKN